MVEGQELEADLHAEAEGVVRVVAAGLAVILPEDGHGVVHVEADTGVVAQGVLAHLDAMDTQGRAVGAKIHAGFGLGVVQVASVADTDAGADGLFVIDDEIMLQFDAHGQGPAFQLVHIEVTAERAASV